jgi:hypothetical protein
VHRVFDVHRVRTANQPEIPRTINLFELDLGAAAIRIAGRAPAGGEEKEKGNGSAFHEPRLYARVAS